jgi:hypothetical protein
VQKSSIKTFNMHIASAYQIHESDGAHYFIVLDCACQYEVTEGMFATFNDGVPCVLHESWRFLGTQPTPAPVDDEDLWADDPN